MAEQGFVQYALAAAGALVVIEMIRRGCFRRDVFDGVPRRERLGIGLLDLLVGFVILLLSAAVAEPVVRGLEDWAIEAGLEASLAQGLVVLTAQIIGYLPVVLYFILRAATAGLLSDFLSGNPVDLDRQMVRRSWRELRLAGVWPRRWSRDLARGARGAVVAVTVVMGLTGLVVAWVGHWVGDPPPEITHALLEVVQASEWWVGVAAIMFAVVVVAPVVEEVIFRGLVQTALVRATGGRWRWAVVLLAGGLFSLVHVGPVLGWHGFVLLFVLGVVMGWLYEKTGSLWPPIVVHAVFNLFNVLMVVFLM